MTGFMRVKDDSEPHPPGSAAPAEARLRSGTAARLSGIPVATLRVWERRHGVVCGPKTATGQRLYSAHDVQRLRLLRQLTDTGHGIGGIAPLSLPDLQSLAAGVVPGDARPVRRLVVVGRSAQHRLRDLSGTEMLAAWDGLAQAEADLATSPAAPRDLADLLLVQLSSLPPDAAERVAALRARWPARAVLVLYAFGAEASLLSLRAGGAIVRREPLGAPELVRLVVASTPATTTPPADARALMLGVTAAPRRYSDDALAALAELPTSVACECPRHLAEIVQQLVAFEQYSADCRNLNPGDAELHRALQGLAATARTLFEEAVSHLVAAEGLDLPALALKDLSLPA